MSDKIEQWNKRRLETDSKMTDREIVEDMALTDWVPIEGKTTRQILEDLIDINVKIALDPRVSKDAVDLYHEGYEDGKSQAVNKYLTGE